MGLIGIVLGAAAALVILALPGFAWTAMLFRPADVAQRIVLSVVLSVALVTLGLYVGNALFGVRVNGAHALWYALAFTAAAIAPQLARILATRVDAAMRR